MIIFPFILGLFWITVHLIRRRFKPKPILPLTNVSNGFLPLRFNISNTTVTLTHLVHLTLNTSAFNKPFDRLTATLGARSKAQFRKTRRILLFVYDAGVIFAGCGIIVVLIALCFFCFTTLKNLFPWSEGPLNTSSIYRRSFSETLHANSGPAITPIIPGVTVPGSHVWSILLTVLVSQIFHELGHAISGALSGLPLQLSGLSLWLCVPSAFVVFPRSATHALPVWSRMRVISSGPFHNILQWSGIWLVKSIVIFIVFSTGILKEIPIQHGLAVTGVRAGSPLQDHLYPGLIISYLDDISLSRDSDRLGTWNTYLTVAVPDSPAQGWCIKDDVFASSDSTCCQETGSENLLTCFDPIKAPSQGCFDAYDVLSSSTPRCNAGSTCICMRPAPQEQIMRLSISSQDGHRDIVLWKGPRHEVFDDVFVSTNLSKFGRHNLPTVIIWVYDLIALLWGYLELASLSLAFFNLLPLPHLDGEALFDTIWENWLSKTSRQENDLEARDFDLDDSEDEGLTRHQSWWRRIGGLQVVLKRLILSIFLCTTAASLFHSIK